MVFLIIMQQADQGSVISEHDKVSVRMGTCTTVGVQDVQEWGQNTSLLVVHLSDMWGPTLTCCELWIMNITTSISKHQPVFHNNALTFVMTLSFVVNPTKSTDSKKENIVH